MISKDSNLVEVGFDGKTLSHVRVSSPDKTHRHKAT